MNDNNFLAVVDLSYWTYYTLFGSAYEFQRKHPDEYSSWVKPAELSDQENLPNLINCSTYKKILKQFVMKRLESIDWVLKNNFQNELDMANRIDIVFAMDDRLKHNFRLELYPEYKAQRQTQKRSYQIQPIKDYVINVLFKELEIEEQHGYKLIKVEGAEGDDVIATLLTKFKDKYKAGMCLIASDHDFLQINGVRQFDLFGKEIKRDLGGEEVSPEDYLLGKILMGDKSDNIQQVFKKCGPKTALKLIKDKPQLKNMLNENQESAYRFQLNKKIISFAEIPEDLSNKIIESINKSLYKNEILNEHKVELKDFMNL